MSIARSFTLVVALALPLSSSRADGTQASAAAPHDGHTATVSPALVEQVREATAPFRDAGSPDARRSTAAFQREPQPLRTAGLLRLHVWGWRDNPLGTFADWNARVSCDGK
jgi:hypothetical protein